MMKKRGLVHIFFLVVLSLCILAGCTVDYDDVKISKVVDGDTVELKNGVFARYIGIDCPELKKHTPEGWVAFKQPFAQEAMEFNRRIVSGRPVRFEFDVQRRDKYNRLLVYCFVKEDGREIFVQEELVRQGLAYLYTFPPNIKYVDVLLLALEEAKSNKVGVWSLDIEINSSQAADYIGERKMVSGIVRRSFSTAKTVGLSMDGLLIVVFKKDLSFFQDAGINPVEFYKGRRVKVFGHIKEYRGELEIIVSHPVQIELID